ncbi:MAG: UDP-glucose 4-epimerase GalE [Candidatus Izemoplasmatales bacterium]|jgi:UDP-glucose 4-epimerase|nr:UDP-glucose 4-epimerase GalE [Candidatus Izemoplasmatales bacterium]
MNILVLGGAGYIGSHFVKKALEANNQIIVIDNLSTGHKKSLPQNIKFYQGDVRDENFMDNVFMKEKIDACVHFCAFSLVGESMKNPLKYFDNNVIGAIRLVEAMVKHDIKKIVFSSTAAVYGSHEKMPITEGFSTEPSNPYGESKLFMEKIFKWSDLAYGIKYVSLRYFNVAGAASDGTIGEVHNPETHLIPIVLEVPLNKRDKLTIFGDDYKTKDGTCIRDYIHVEDLAEAHLLALDYLSKGNDSNIFNLGSQTGYSNLEILNTAEKVTEKPIPVVIGDRRPGDPDMLIASNQKAKEFLHWEVKRDINQIITNAWQFHQKHPNGYGEDGND